MLTAPKARLFGASRHLHSLESAFASHSFGVHNLETGIKVLDLSAPYKKGGKVGLFGGAGVGKTVVIMELIRSLAVVGFTRPSWHQLAFVN